MFHHFVFWNQGAKEDSDAFLTGVISRELAQKSEGTHAFPGTEPKGVSEGRHVAPPEAMESCGPQGKAPPTSKGEQQSVRGPQTAFLLFISTASFSDKR